LGKSEACEELLQGFKDYTMENVMTEEVHIECSNTEKGELVCEVKTRGELGMLRYRHIFPKGISEADAKDQIRQGLKTRGEAILRPGQGRAGRPKKQNAKEVT
jgi:hypothetical protein